MTDKKKPEQPASQPPNPPRRLPIVTINGKRYFLDERLGEYRNVEDPMDRLPL